MTVLPNDFVRLHGPAADVDLNCVEHNLPWPPPDTITSIGAEQLDVPFVLVTMSELTDDQANNEHIARGAYYLPITDIEPGDPE